MTLAKRHVQRLWFPLPGVGGSIPSRAENAMSDEEFNALMPNEFWREVVDRVAVEVPAHCSSLKPSGSSKATSFAPSACTASTTPPS